MKREEKTTIERRLTNLQSHLNMIGFDNNISQAEINSTTGNSKNLIYCARPIANDDFDKGYLQLLSQLTSVGNISKDAFIDRLSKMDKDTYRIVVIEDPNSNRIVAAATIFVELKFVHECGKVGHIEDVVVDSSVRGQYLGVKVIEACKQFAKEKGCYKTILDCSEKNVPFYARCGFKKKELQMRFDHD